MKSFLLVLRYLLNGGARTDTEAMLVRWVVGSGLVLLAATPIAFFLFSAHAAFIVALCAALGLMIPCIVAMGQFRFLIASRRITLLPNAQLKAALALLLITLLATLYLYLLYSLFDAQEAHSPPLQIALHAFFWFSLIVLGGQWLTTVTCRMSPSFRSVYWLLFYPMVKLLSWLPSTLTDTTLLLPASLLLWLVALAVFTKPHTYKPMVPWTPTGADSSDDTRARSNEFPGFPVFTGFLRRSRSAGGTLLLGYPDAWTSRFVAQAQIVVLWPGLFNLLMYWIGTVSNDGAFRSDRFIMGFLMFSYFFSMGSAFTHINLIARARLLWLKAAGSRAELWRFMERQLLSNFMILSLLLSLLWLLIKTNHTAADTLHAFERLPQVLAAYLCMTYYLLAARAGSWPEVALVLPAIATLNVLIPPQSLSERTLSILLILTLALLFRWLAKRYVLRLDWRPRPATTAFLSEPP
jgi:hypothetical protein